MTRRRETTPLTAADAGRHLAQANEFLAAAEAEIVAERFNAAAGNAAVAVVNAADAVAGLRLGERWTGPHELAGRHVAQAGTEGKQLERAMQRAVPFKNRAQYDPTPVPPAKARSLVEVARRAVAAANRVAAGVGPPASSHMSAAWEGERTAWASTSRRGWPTGPAPHRGMSADAYRPAVSRHRDRLPLTGSLPSTPWDPRLRDAMTTCGVAVHEEEVRRQLLDAMRV